MRIYLAARYSRREEMKAWRERLQRYGYTITSRWINGDHEIVEGEGSALASFQDRRRFAMEDVEDIRSANIVISFTEEPRAKPSRGGRHFEFGLSYGLSKRCIVIGPLENFFHTLPWVEHYPEAEWGRAEAKLAADMGFKCGATGAP